MINPVTIAVAAFLTTVAACAADTGIRPPSEPHRLVYTLASANEVVLLDLNSITKDGDIAEAWSLAILAEPTQLESAPEAAKVFWMRTRIDCAGRMGEFTHAIGMKDGQPAFDLAMSVEPTPLETAWPIDEDFVCKDVQNSRIAATTFSEAMTVAARVMGGTPSVPQEGVTPAPVPPASTLG